MKKTRFIPLIMTGILLFMFCGCNDRNTSQTEPSESIVFLIDIPTESLVVEEKNENSHPVDEIETEPPTEEAVLTEYTLETQTLDAANNQTIWYTEDNNETSVPQELSQSQISGIEGDSIVGSGGDIEWE